jgi:hypothetical protein
VGDLVFMVITIAFFAVCVAYVRLCDRIIGPDPATAAPVPAGKAEPEAVTA